MIDQGLVRVYACGGAGINIASLLEKHRNNDDVGAAKLHITYIDTSKSNLARNRHSIADEHIYVIDGLDGSGKIRAENYEAITSHAKDVLQAHKPMDLNIVISSAAGGSGSVIAPTIVGELLDRKVPTIVLMVGSTATRLDAENTLKTIKSYESIAQRKKAPVVAIYAENSANVTRGDVDESLKYAVLTLAILYSRQNHELDSQDLFNWLRYDRVTSFDPQLAALTIRDGRDLNASLSDLGHVISVATLGSSPDQVYFPTTPDYQCAGFLPESSSDRFKERCPFNYIVSDGIFPDIHARLNSFLKDLSEGTAARIVKRNIVSRDDDATETGLIL